MWEEIKWAKAFGYWNISICYNDPQWLKVILVCITVFLKCQKGGVYDLYCSQQSGGNQHWHNITWKKKGKKEGDAADTSW